MARLAQAGYIRCLSFSLPAGRFLAASKELLDPPVKKGNTSAASVTTGSQSATHQVVLFSVENAFRFVKSDAKAYRQHLRQSAIKRHSDQGEQCYVHPDRITSLAFSRANPALGINYSSILSASVDGLIRIWEYSGERGHGVTAKRYGRQFRCPFPGRRSRKIRAAALSPDGLVVTAVADDAACHIWRLSYQEAKAIPIMSYRLPRPAPSLCCFLAGTLAPDTDPHDPRRFGSPYYVGVAGAARVSTHRAQRSVIRLIEFSDTAPQLLVVDAAGPGDDLELSILKNAGTRRRRGVPRAKESKRKTDQDTRARSGSGPPLAQRADVRPAFTQYSSDDRKQMGRQVAVHAFHGAVHSLASTPVGQGIVGGVSLVHTQSGTGDNIPVDSVVMWTRIAKKLHMSVIGVHEKPIWGLAVMSITATNALKINKLLRPSQGLIGAGGSDEALRVWRYDQATSGPIALDLKRHAKGTGSLFKSQKLAHKGVGLGATLEQSNGSATDVLDSQPYAQLTHGLTPYQLSRVKHEQAQAARAETNSDFKRGDRVLARWKGSDVWQPAIILHARLKYYGVKYTNIGHVDSRVPKSHVFSTLFDHRYSKESKDVLKVWQAQVKPHLIHMSMGAQSAGVVSEESDNTTQSYAIRADPLMDGITDALEQLHQNVPERAEKSLALFQSHASAQTTDGPNKRQDLWESDTDSDGFNRKVTYKVAKEHAKIRRTTCVSGCVIN